MYNGGVIERKWTYMITLTLTADQAEVLRIALSHYQLHCLADEETTVQYLLDHVEIELEYQEKGEEENENN